jgi:hypothetical protein
MSRRPRIPPELTQRPFSLEEARAAGLSKTSLQSKAWRRIGTELYTWSGLPEDPWQVLDAWQDSLPADAVFAGATAAWISGLDFKPIDPVEIAVPPQSGMRSRPAECDVAGFRRATWSRSEGSARPPCTELSMIYHFNWLQWKSWSRWTWRWLGA